MAGNHEAFRNLMRLMEREAKLLGLDAPQRWARGGNASAPPVREVSAQLVVTPEVVADALKALAEAGRLPSEIAEAWVYGPTEGPDEGADPPLGGG